MADHENREPIGTLLARCSVGGVLMGLANLVPGISGGTMLLASGVYTAFVEAVAEVTTFRFRARSVALLATIALSAAAAILLLAGPVKYLVTEHRWVMYSLFIGLTLGGVPLVWRRARPATPVVWAGAGAGFLAMALLLFAQASGSSGSGYVILVVAGIAGACAMILPGVSGAYLLLVLGQYETILGAVDQLKDGLGGDTALMLTSMHVVVPVGIGVLAGIIGISNLVRWTLKRFTKATLGVLLGLLFGALLGIWPFQEAVGKGEPRVFFQPSLVQVVSALALIVAGFGVTVLIDRLGRNSHEDV